MLAFATPASDGRSVGTIAEIHVSISFGILVLEEVAVAIGRARNDLPLLILVTGVLVTDNGSAVIRDASRKVQVCTGGGVLNCVHVAPDLGKDPKLSAVRVIALRVAQNSGTIRVRASLELHESPRGDVPNEVGTGPDR